MYIETPFAYTGSKYKLLSQLQKYFIVKDNFVDLFAGGGAVYSNVTNIYNTIFVNDIIKELIDIHKRLSQNNEIIEKMKSMVVDKNDQIGFLKLRTYFNQERDAAALWALMINCTNNMIRFNKSFKFNQTFGKRTLTNSMIQKIDIFANHLQKNLFKFSSLSFEKFPIMKNTLYYCDPPYSQTSAGYNAFWCKDNDIILFEYLKKINEIGSNFIVSGVLTHDNKINPLIESLINFGFNYDELNCNYNKVSRKGNKNTIEVVCYNYEIKKYDELEKRRINGMLTQVTSNLFKVGDTVSLPLNEEGVIVNINTKCLDWFPYRVKITKGDLFHPVGDIETFKESDIKKLGE